MPQHLLELSFDAQTDFIQFDSTYGNDRPNVLAFDATVNVVHFKRPAACPVEEPSE